MVTILQDMVKKGLIAQANGKWTLMLALEMLARLSQRRWIK